MSKTGKIVIGIIIGVLAIWLVLKFVGKIGRAGYDMAKAENNNPNNQTANTIIPDAVQKELKYHSEGETLTYQGTKYAVIGGKWVKV